MKWLRIILLYIAVGMMASCAAALATVPGPEPNVTVTVRNDTEFKKVVLIYNWTKGNVNVAAADVLPGKQAVFTNFAYDTVYDIKWNSSWPKYQTISWYSFRVQAGKVYILSKPLESFFIYGDIDADYEFVNNSEHIKRTGPNTFR